MQRSQDLKTYKTTVGTIKSVKNRYFILFNLFYFASGLFSNQESEPIFKTCIFGHFVMENTLILNHHISRVTNQFAQV